MRPKSWPPLLEDGPGGRRAAGGVGLRQKPPACRHAAQTDPRSIYELGTAFDEATCASATCSPTRPATPICAWACRRRRSLRTGGRGHAHGAQPTGSTDYLCFVARGDGSSAFSRSSTNATGPLPATSGKHLVKSRFITFRYRQPQQEQPESRALPPIESRGLSVIADPQARGLPREKLQACCCAEAMHLGKPGVFADPPRAPRSADQSQPWREGRWVECRTRFTDATYATTRLNCGVWTKRGSQRWAVGSSSPAA